MTAQSKFTPAAAEKPATKMNVTKQGLTAPARTDDRRKFYVREDDGMVIPTVKFAQVPIDLICDKKLSAGAVRLYAYMLWRYGKNQQNFERREGMAAALGVSKPTITRWAKELEARDWVAIKTQQRPSGQFTTNFYYVFDRPEACKDFKKKHPELHRPSRKGIGGRPKSRRAEKPLTK